MRLFKCQRSILILSALAWLGAMGAAPAANATAVQLDVGLLHPVLLAGQKNTVQMRVSLLGQEPSANGPRPQANVCIAIDRSGSMAGEKLANARVGALSALGKLRDSDFVSVVAYDDVVRVMVPATRASDRAAIEAGISQLTPGGGTALFAGVVKCAAEVRKFASQNRVNRIVLLSDGMANVGPSSPSELGALGSDLAAEGISVATVGLGLDYNEDLMAELAVRSDGSHVFVERAGDLTRFLDQELGAITTVVARDVEVKIRCDAGARPLRVIGRAAQIVGQTVTTTLGKIYGHRQHLFVVEMELDPARAGSTRPLAEVGVDFRDLLADRAATLRQPIAATFTARGSEVEERTNPRIVSELGMLNADVATEQAIQLRDQGNFAAAQQLLKSNADQLDAVAKKYKDSRLTQKVSQAKQQAATISNLPVEWNVQRKAYKKQSSEDLLNGL